MTKYLTEKQQQVPLTFQSKSCKTISAEPKAEPAFACQHVSMSNFPIMIEIELLSGTIIKCNGIAFNETVVSTMTNNENTSTSLMIQKTALYVSSKSNLISRDC